jgi:hypothetical protein
MESWINKSFASKPRLPDAEFLNQKSQFGQILECHGMDKVGKFYISAIWYAYFKAIGNVVAIWYIFPCYVYCV